MEVNVARFKILHNLSNKIYFRGNNELDRQFSQRKDLDLVSITIFLLLTYSNYQTGLQWLTCLY